MYTKKCAVCGKEFETKYKNSKFCKGPHYKTCPVCGNTFQIDDRIAYCYENWDKVCCSRRCGLIYAHSKRTDKQKRDIVNKVKNTKKIRYGDENFNNKEKSRKTHIDKCSSDPCRAKLIQEKIKKTKLAKYGDPNYNNPDKRRDTNIKIYGVDNAAKSEKVKEKAKKTNMERYGVTSQFKRKEFKEKSKQTCLSKYGTEHASQSSRVLDTKKRNNIEKYGVDSTFKLPSTKKKVKETMYNRYGGWYTGTEDYRRKVRTTSLEKYGVEHFQQSDKVKDKRASTNQKKYGVDSTLQLDSVQRKSRKTKLEKYGVDHQSKSPVVRSKIVQTTMLHYGVEYPLQSERIQEKVRATNRKRLGVDYPMQSSKVLDKNRSTCLEKYGVSSVMKVPSVRCKQARSAHNSNLEKRISSMLTQYNIEFIPQYVVKKGSYIHAFDFYIPRYRILLDADGTYYHSYKSDPDGRAVRDDYDEVRMYLIPKDHVFILAVEGYEDRAIKEVHDVIKKMDSNVFNYDTELFTWCREVGFPYPNYTESRMKKDWNSLCKYQSNVYKPNAKLGYSIIKNFHKSLYDVKVGNVSVRKAWEDDKLLRKVIENRLIYKNNVDPSKVLQGFNISKVCPIASIFNPILAKHLVETYLNEFNEVFDPFSGFSGRMLGVASLGKKYKGQDLNPNAVKESNEIIKFLNLSNAEVSQKDVLKSSGTYECLLTCPPYNRKEVYNKEVVFKTCDGWIEECLSRFKCRRYVFVVDETSKFKDNIVEEIKKSSHLTNTTECVVVVDR